MARNKENIDGKCILSYTHSYIYVHIWSMHIQYIVHTQRYIYGVHTHKKEFPDLNRIVLSYLNEYQNTAVNILISKILNHLAKVFKYFHNITIILHFWLRVFVGMYVECERVPINDVFVLSTLSHSCNYKLVNIRQYKSISVCIRSVLPSYRVIPEYKNIMLNKNRSFFFTQIRILQYIA